MATQPLAKNLDRNPRTFEEARQLVKYVESLFNTWNLDAVIEGFTPDCIVRLSDLPEFKGQHRLREMFIARNDGRRNYKLVKTLKALMNDVICNTWECEWFDGKSGKTMAGFGCEFWTMRDGKIALWEGAFNSWVVGAAQPSPFS